MSSSAITFNLMEGSVSFSFTPAAANNLKAALQELTERMKAASAKVASGGGTSPQEPIEYQYTGDVFLEIFCNPNIWANPFAAKVLITLRDERIRLSTEAELTRVIEDVNQYLEQFHR
ncbi:hypothetical protein [Floridanema evergladense]|uniref:Uncharacterized protein n=1 Tax=Floridaenema evergladense BLCC-F167 TaxID=3153639 RepID=A0ABV4WN10_9CYAN